MSFALNNFRNLAYVLSATALLAMAGCGGGGSSSSGNSGGGSTSTPVTVTGTQSRTIARTSLSALSLSSLGTGMSTLSTSVTGVQVAGTPSRGMSVRDLIGFVINKVETQPSTPQSLTGVVLVPTSGCGWSGTLGMSDTRTSLSASYTSADVITMAFAQCVSSSGGSSLNGTVTFSNMSFTSCVTPGSCPLASATITFNIAMATPSTGEVFTMTNVAISHSNNGTTTTDSMTGTSLKMVSATTVDEISNFTFSSTLANATLDVSEVSSYTISSSTIGGSISVATTTPFVTVSGAANPGSGVMEVTSNVTPADPGALRITVNGTLITVDFYQNGFGSAVTTSNYYTWTTI